MTTKKHNVPNMVLGYKENSNLSPSFIFDVAPFFLPSALIIINMLVYQIHPNPVIMPLAVFLLTPLYNKFVMDDNTNLKKSVEKAFMQSWLFNIPLWVCVGLMVVAWVHGMIMFSEEPYWQEMRKDNFLFQHRPETGHLMFWYMLSYTFFQAFPITAGHELIHRR